MSLAHAAWSPQEDAAIAPLSFAQERLWAIDRLSPGAGSYNVRRAIRMHGVLDVCALERSLGDIFNRHEILRTTFSVVDSEPMQVIAPPSAFALPLVDLTDRNESDAQAAVSQFVRDEGDRGFDLAVGPLVRATLLRLNANEHVLFVIMHHIVTDDWSTGVFNRELSLLYAAHREGRPAVLPSLEVQYADFAVWQRDWLDGEVLEHHVRYWRDALADAPHRIDLPVDRAGTAALRLAGASESIRLSPTLADGARALARAHDATLFMTLLATFNILLYRYCGQRDMVIGAPIANRNRPELESLIGCFVNTLPLRARLDGSTRCSDLLRQIRATTLAAYDHAELPFEQLVSRLHVERIAGENPLVNVLFHVQPKREDAFGLTGLQLSAFPLENSLSKFDLVFRVSERADALDCSIVYSTDLFDRSGIQQILGHFERLLGAIIAAPETTVAALPMLTDVERNRYVVDWNDTSRTYPDDTSLAALFAAVVERSPDAIALVSDGVEFSYARLDALADELAGELLARGLGPEELVGVCTQRSSAMVVATLAVLKAGGAYLPIDPDYPTQRIRHMLVDAGVRIVLTRHRSSAHLPHDLPGLAMLEVNLEAPSQRSRLAPLPRANGSQLAYVIYTSGSTGTPKGVLVTQRAVCRLVMNANYVAVDERDVVAQVSSFCFDAITFELWSALLHGARLEIASRETILSTGAFAGWLQSRRISVMFLTAALFRLMSHDHPSAFAGLRCLLVGGEAVDPLSTAAVLAAGAPGRLLNGYGPTETTTFATTYEVTEPGSKSIPIGRPISNTAAFVLDDDFNPVPIGAPGQLYIGGPGVARGYLNDPALTAAKFVANPFATDGERLYATGDIVRYLRDGNIDFIGRRDRQVKIRGFRVETGEIEAALRQLPGVRDAFVRAERDADGDHRLVAYVVDGGSTPSAPATDYWRRALATELPSYMLPAAVVRIPELPINRNGKVDLEALPQPSAAGATEPAAVIMNPLHHQIGAIWEKLLDLPQIGIRDNFFDIGGHSLLAARMIVLVENETGKAVSLARFIENPTIAHVTRLLLENRDRPAASPVTALNPNGARPPLFFAHSDLNGGGYYTRKFARSLEPDQPFYVLTPHGSDGRPCPPTIEEMAQEFISAIRAERPHGPYVLGGYCSGGLVALEIARRLRQEGVEVRNVILLDVLATNARLGHAAAVIDRLAAAFKLGSAVPLRVCSALGRSAAAGRRCTGWLRRTVRLTRLGGITALAQRLFGNRIKTNNGGETEYPWLEPFWRKVTMSHIPRPYDGPISLLLSQEYGPMDDSAIVRRWRTISRRLVVYSVPGEHLTCITRYAQETAAQLAQVLVARAPVNPPDTRYDATLSLATPEGGL